MLPRVACCPVDWLPGGVIACNGIQAAAACIYRFLSAFKNAIFRWVVRMPGFAHDAKDMTVPGRPALGGTTTPCKACT